MKPTVLLTPGPLTTSAAVKQAMLQDLGTRDDEYRMIIQSLREQLCKLGQVHPAQYALIFMQGSGTFGVESVLTSTIRQDEHVLILANGAYGNRMAQICETAHIPFTLKNYPMDKALPLDEVKEQIADPRYTHVAYVHCETTAGVMNDLYRIQECIRS